MTSSQRAVGAEEARDRGGERGDLVHPLVALWEHLCSGEGKTEALAEAVRPQQIQVLTPAPAIVRRTSIRIAEDGARADVSFSDGTQVTVRAEELYAQKG